MSNPFDSAWDAAVPPPPPARDAVQASGSAATYARRAEVEEAVDQSDEERAAQLAEFRAQVDSIVDGIYFSLPAEVYHAVPRLSASGLQKLCVSPATFWRGSWLDPERPEMDDDQTKAQVLGRAYHTARLEPELFDGLYVRQIDKADMPKGTLFTGVDMGRALGELGLPKSGSVAEQAERLVDAGWPGTIWQVELAKWEAERNGRTAIPAVYYDQIATDMGQIRENSEIADLLTGGEAEVSIFWTDKHGLKMKARVDYLTAALWDDFKTFANPNGKELETAIADAIRYNRHHVQAVTYRDAVEAIRTGGLQINGKATDAQRKMVAAIQMKPGELACWYIYKEKDGTPNLLAYEFDFFHVPMNTRAHNAIGDDDGVAMQEAVTRTKTELHVRAVMDVDRAKRAFVLHSQVYAPGTPWFPIKARRSTSDLGFNQHWLEGKS